MERLLRDSSVAVGACAHPKPPNPCLLATAATLLAYGCGVTEASGDRPWFWEGHVQSTLAVHLASKGWEVREAADTESKAAGIDLLAEQCQRWLAIEVKGYPSTTYDHGPKRGQPKPTQPSNQARQWFSHVARDDAAPPPSAGRRDRDLPA